jgi:hypothetical protein
MKFYQNGKCIGERFCGICDRPAITVIESTPVTRDEVIGSYNGWESLDSRVKSIAVNHPERKRVQYLCGYHSPFRGINGKTKAALKNLS